MASRMYFLVIVILSTVYNILGDTHPNFANKTACYGKVLFPKECPPNGRYSIFDLKFGAKKATVQCPNNTIQNQASSCCNFSPEDCFVHMPYNDSVFFYDAISGYHEIKGTYLIVGWTRISSQCLPGNNRQYSNYGFISTYCVDDHTILNMYSSSISSGRKLYVQFRGVEHNMQNIYDNYTCEAHAKLGGLIVYSVDVRLQDYHLKHLSEENTTFDNNEGICNNSHEVVIEDTNNTTSIKCENYTILGYNHTYFHSRKGPVVISLHIGTAARTVPQMVWLAIEADSDNDNIEVNCNDGTYSTATIPVTHTIKPSPPKANGSVDNGSTDKPEGSEVDWTIILGASVGGVIVVSIIIGSIIYVKRRNAKTRNEQQARIEIRNQMRFGKQPVGRQNNMRTDQKENVRSGNIPGYRVENVRRHDTPDAHSRNIQSKKHHKKHKRNETSGDKRRDDMEMNSPVYVNINEMKRHRAGRK